MVTAGTATHLTLPETFFWGCVGGLIAGVGLFFLPQVLAAHLKGRTFRPQLGPALTTAGVIVVFTLMAGGITLTFNQVMTVGLAIKLGLGAQGTIKGLLEGGREVFNPRNEDRPSP